MRKISVFSVILCLVLATFSVTQYSCNERAEAKADSVSIPKTMTHGEMVERGRYLITAASCGDCHCPKVFTPQGPIPDSARLYSGHPANMPMMPIDKKVLKPGNWMMMGPDVTSFVGPWGVSFAANLTPDTATGIGAWTADVFIKTLRTGKHLGQEGGRPILPPMPWPTVAQFTDEDLKSIFSFLQSLPPISNKVPAPLTPVDVAKMK
ncbi:MAG: diheme cytochrome c-553 [Bacteroidetes bacterium]|nr:MAG: diheme cytochrome c-553 [Bacteroidota bacterium]